MQNRYASRKHGIRMSFPARDWREALPCGNGPIAALVYGCISPETIVFNHDALWYDGNLSDLPDISENLPGLRKFLSEGNFEKANTLYPEKLAEKGFNPVLPQLHPAFDLKIKMPASKAFTDYYRYLDFSTGQACVVWKDGSNEYEREFFISRADDVAVMRIRSKTSSKINVSFQLCERSLFDAIAEDGFPIKNPFEYVSEVKGNQIIMKVSGSDGGDYAGVLRVIARGGSVSGGIDTTWTEQMTGVPFFRAEKFSDQAFITIEDSDEILVLIALQVNDIAEKCIRGCCELLGKAPQDYDKLLSRHVELHGKLFEAMKFELDPDMDRDISNEHLLIDAYKAKGSKVLIEKMFDFGRYLLLSCSSPESNPPTLQGTWNGDYCPPWRSIYVHNENTQMFYWQALPGNMAETAHAYFNYFESFLEDYRENARRLWNCRGIFIPLTQTVNTGLLQDRQSHVINFTGVAPWIAQLFYDYWLYTRDDDFLKNSAVPFMKEVADFYEDFILVDNDGYNLFMPSNSPENAPSNSFPEDIDFNKIMNPGIPITIDSTVDRALAKELLNNLCYACEYLGIEQDSVAHWHQMQARMKAYRINDDGALAEWINPNHTDNYAHRHISHLYPVFPGFEITREDSKELFEACEVALEKRLSIGLESQTGWSLAHIANIYARLGMGDKTMECLDIMTRSCVGANLFAYHNDWRNMGVTLKLILGRSAPFQVDASMGYTAAILEMLIFSTPDKIKILPALPKEWKQGKIEGVQCRNSMELTIAWDMYESVINMRIKSKIDAETILQFPRGLKDITSDTKGAVKDSDKGREYRELIMSADSKLCLDVRLCELS